VVLRILDVGIAAFGFILVRVPTALETPVTHDATEVLVSDSHTQRTEFGISAVNAPIVEAARLPSNSGRRGRSPRRERM
jgi:hypothetical protein